MGRTRSATAEPRSMIASAVTGKFTEPLWNKYFSTDEAWQTEIWRLYDVVPEFSRGANWVGSACSRVRVFVAEIDEAGEVQQEVPKKSPYAKYSYHLFGGPARQQELLRLMGVDLTVSGEFWILGIDGDGDEEDKWYAVSRNELQRAQMTIATNTEPLLGEPPEVYEFFDGKMRHQLIEGEDIMYRCWTPHPYRTWNADSPGRSLQMVLVELEILTQYILAQARSRLASAGVWIWPSGNDFPTNDGEAVGGDDLMNRMLQAGEQNMKSFGSASQVLPMIVEMPEKVFDRIKAPIVFGSELSKEAMELRRELRERLAAGMDIAPEIVTGMGEATGWNTFSITADTVETVVKPIMARICNAATQVYLWPALKAAGKPWKRYKFWFDTAALTIRPQRLKETMELRQMGIVSDAEVLKAADLPPSAAITSEERERDLATALLKSDGNLLAIADLRKKAGLNISIAPDGIMPGQEQTAPGLGGRAPAPPPPERTLKEATGPSEVPRNSARPGSPASVTPEPVAASAAPATTTALVVAANAAVLQALEKAGKALLRDPRGAQFRSVPHNEVYLHLSPRNRDHAQALLASGWTHLDALLTDLGRQDEVPVLRSTLMDYCLHLMTGEDRPLVHEVRVMRGWLRGFL
jgi:hypothetical protein